jgi:hypothetical protein
VQNAFLDFEADEEHLKAKLQARDPAAKLTRPVQGIWTRMVECMEAGALRLGLDTPIAEVAASLGLHV